MHANFDSEICMATKLKGFSNYFSLTVDKPLNAIKKVIFDDPVTIVFWADGTKTFVKAGEDDIFDPEKGLAMAIAKKFLGNRGNYYEAFRKHLNEAGIDDIHKNGEEERCLQGANLTAVDVSRSIIDRALNASINKQKRGKMM